FATKWNEFLQHYINNLKSIYSQIEELVDTPPIVLENSVTKKPRGRPVGAENKNKRTTQKDLSAFEHVEKQSRQCGTCHQPGYNS
ncbi:11618_t:CDS:2, partial [Gigaspora rosea]